MGSIKGRNGMDLTEEEDIKKRCQEYTEGLYKKDLHNPDNHDGVITHLEPDILEWEVKWALESITMTHEKMLNITHQRNANQNHNKVPLYASQDGCYPKVYKQ